MSEESGIRVRISYPQGPPPPPPPPPPSTEAQGAPPPKKKNTNKTAGVQIRGTNRVSAPQRPNAKIRDDWKNSYKSKINGIPELENWKGGFLVARDRWKKRETGEITKQYNWAESWEDVYHDIMNVLGETSVEEFLGRNYYELWTEHNPLKLFFDFELKEPFQELPHEFDKTQSEQWEELINSRIAHIREHSRTVLMMEYGVAVSKDDFAILQSTKLKESGAVEKYSFHIVLTRGVYFQDGKHLKNFFDNVLFPKQMLEDDKKMAVHLRKYEGIDSGVYGISRMLRMPLCSKLGEVRPLEIETNHSFEQCLVTHCPPEDGMMVEFKAKKKSTSSGSKKKTTVEQLIDGESSKLTVESQGELEKLFDFLPMTIAEDYDCWTKTGMFWKRAGGSFDKWDEWSRRYLEWRRERDGVESHRDPSTFRTKWDGFSSDTNVNYFLDWVLRHGRKRALVEIPVTETAPDGEVFEDGSTMRVTLQRVEAEIQPDELFERVKSFRKINSVEYTGILHNEIAKSFHLRFSEQHKFSNGSWWWFNGVTWQRDDDAMEISKNILKWHKEIDDRLRHNKERLARHGVLMEEEEEDAGEDANYAGKKRKAMSLVEATATDSKHKEPHTFMEFTHVWHSHDFSTYKYATGSSFPPSATAVVTEERKLYKPKLWEVRILDFDGVRTFKVQYMYDMRFHPSNAHYPHDSMCIENVDFSKLKNFSKKAFVLTDSRPKPTRTLKKIMNVADLNFDWPMDDHSKRMNPEGDEEPSRVMLCADMERSDRCGFEEKIRDYYHVLGDGPGTVIEQQGHKCVSCCADIEEGALAGTDGSSLHDEVHLIRMPGCNCEYHVGCFNRHMFDWIENGEDPNECICPKCTLNGIKQKVDRMNRKLRRIKQITQDGSIGNNNALKCEFHDSTFTETLDMNTALLGFKDGIFDLNGVDPVTGKRSGVFRKANPDDRVTKTVGYDFLPFDWAFYRKKFRMSTTDRLKFACGRSEAFQKGRKGKDGLLLEHCKNCQSVSKNPATIRGGGGSLIPKKVLSISDDIHHLSMVEDEYIIPKNLPTDFEMNVDLDGLASEADVEDDPALTDALSEDGGSVFDDDIANDPDPDDPTKCEHLRIYYSMELIEDLFEKIFPNAEVRHYARIFHASLLCGECPDEKIHFYTGMNSGDQTGSNGKSTVDSLNMKLLGEYAVPGHPSLLTDQRESAGSANSAFMALKGARYVSFQEIQDSGNGQTVLNMQVIKTLTGNDYQTGREMYEKQSKPFLPTWKIAVSANKLPPVSMDDGGTRRRLADIPFEAKFMRTADDVEEALASGLKHVYLIDFTLKTKINNDLSVRQAYFHMLARVFPIWRRWKLPKCAAVEAHTNEYLNNQDIVKLWLNETFKFTGKPEDVVDANGLYEVFKVEKKTLPQPLSNSNKTSLVQEVSRKARWGKPDEAGKWYGYRPQNEMYARQLDMLARRSGSSPTAAGR